MQIGVFHPGTQHSWQTAYALQTLGRLRWYYTSIFYQPDKLPYSLEKHVPGALSRRLHAEFRRFSHTGLDPSMVRTVGLEEWLERLAARAGFRRMAQLVDTFGNARFVRHIAAEIQSDDRFALWGYNGSSRTSFELAKHLGRACILDRTNGDFEIYNRRMAQVREQFGEWFIPVEREVPAATIASDREEYALADRIVVGSDFARDTIAEATGDPAIAAKTDVLRYCYDEALFSALPEPREVDPNAPVRFLFLGLVIPRKGIHHILEAIARIPRSAAQLTIVGDMKVPPAAFAPYADRVTYHRTVARADVPAIMAAHDVLLLPSYFEGAGIVLYEALAAGCGLIQSRNCADAVTPQTGILLDAVSTDDVYAAMMTAIDDRARLGAWRQAAQAEAQKYTFARYCDNIAALLKDMALWD